MKKKFTLSLILLLMVAMVATMAGCGGNSGSTGTDKDKSSSSKGVLKVGMECGYAPYNWTQSDDSNGAVPIQDSSDYAYGYDVMMAKYIAESMGYDLQVYKIDWDSLPLAVQSGKIDAVIAGQSITADRLKTVDFSTPYYYASVVGLTKKDSKYADAKSYTDLTGATVTSQLNTIWYDVLKQIPNANILAAQESVPAMLVALESGKADAIVTDMPTAMAAVVAYPDMKVLDFAQGTGFKVSDEDVNIGISVKKGNTELLDKINKALAQKSKTDFEKMMNEAISVQPLSKNS